MLTLVHVHDCLCVCDGAAHDLGSGTPLSRSEDNAGESALSFHLVFEVGSLLFLLLCYVCFPASLVLEVLSNSDCSSHFTVGVLGFQMPAIELDFYFLIFYICSWVLGIALRSSRLPLPTEPLLGCHVDIFDQY